MSATVRDVLQRDAIAESEPAAVAALLDDDSIHLWRLPYRHGQRRAPLRALLAAYLDVDVDNVVLRQDEHGKPRLAGHQDAGFSGDEPGAKIERTREAMSTQSTCDFKNAALRFSWSHSDEMALVALARGIELGVDVERVRERKRALELARRFFDPAEARALAACPADEREIAFLRLWCAKESVLKALGRGIAFGLERVAFALETDAWRPARFAGEAGEASAWQMRALNPAAGYIGALAWCCSPRKVLAWRPPAGD